MQFLDTLAAHPTLFVVCCGLLGLLIGSFLNVVIYRVPVMMENELRAECCELAGTDLEAGNVEVAAVPDERPPFNLVVPRSACPGCKAPITAVQNIPVVSWLALRGRCASCKRPISARYPLVELATGVLSAVVAWRFGYGATALAGLFFTWILIALTMIDFDTQLLPDQLTYPLLWLGLLMSLAHPAWSPLAPPVTPRDAILGAAIGYLSLWSLYWIYKLLTGKEGMGYGDFKLFAAFGAWLGPVMLLPVIIFSSGVGAIFGLVLLLRQRKGLDTRIAFGPFLAIAGWLALICGHWVMARYFALFMGPAG